MKRNLFVTIMEAEGDMLQPFDDSEGTPVEEPVAGENTSPQSTPDTPTEPPPLNEEDSFSYPDESGTGEEEPTGDDDTDNKEDGKLSDKVNTVLNQKLYQLFLNRNNEIDEIIKNIQSLVPLLPFDVVTGNDELVSKLKTAYNSGCDYIINKFVDAKYGENLMFYQKLDALYVLLLNDIDDNLRKIKT